MTEPLTPQQERSALAAELALGVLEGEDRAQALRLKLADPEFARAVTDWERRFDPLCTDFDAATPPNVWPAVERRLGPDPEAAVRRWRFATIGSGAVAAGLALTLLLRPLPAPVEIVRVQAPEQVMVAQLNGGENAVMLAANYDPEAGELRIRAEKMSDGDLAPELWVIPADGVPRSLGMVPRDGLSRMPVASGHRAMMHDGATLAITMEPRDGLLHAAPSSAPIAAGKISTI